MAKLKVYAGLMSGRGKVQVRTVAAVTSRAELSRLTGESEHHLKGYWSQTGNKKEIEAALANPHQVLQASSSMGSDFEVMADAGPARSTA